MSQLREHPVYPRNLKIHQCIKALIPKTLEDARLREASEAPQHRETRLDAAKPSQHP